MGRNVQLKICGITNLVDRDMVIAAGADFMGTIIDVPSSPRSVSLTEAVILCNTRQILRVAVMANPDEQVFLKVVKQISPDAVQLHGDESPEFIQTVKKKADINVWKALHIPADSLDKRSTQDTIKQKVAAYSEAGVRTFLMDTVVKTKNGEQRGGTGQQFDWNLMEGLSNDTNVRFFVAGGLDSKNIGDLLSLKMVCGVDVNSGVELYPGRKDAARIRRFMKEYRRGLLRYATAGQ